MTDRLHHPLPFGAEPTAEGHTRFRFWAPARASVSLEIQGRKPLTMHPVGDGWFEREVRCRAGSRYRYRLPDGLAVPDPASRLQRGGVHGHSVVVDTASYRWKNLRWRGRPWRETVIYELHVGAFGGYAGVQAELARLADLGVTAIELMPLSAFPGTRNWGYDGVLPFAPAEAYGSPDQLKALIDAAHGLGLQMFLDVVYNHFGPDGNYLGCYAPQFFDAEKSSPWGQAIDFSRPEVRDFFLQNALYWLHEYRFDGLRFDAVDHIGDPSWLDEMAAAVRASLPRGRHVHLMLENGANRASHLEGDFDAQWNDDGHHALHVLLSGESDGYYADYASAPAEALATCLGEGFIYQGQRSALRKRAQGTPSKHLPPTAFVFFLQNHDQIGNRALSDRLASLAAPQALAAAQALLLLCPHIPLLFMGDEWASRTPFYFFTDHGPELARAVREGRKREFAGFGAFADPALTVSIADPNDAETFERSRLDPAEARRPSHTAALKRTRALLELRAKHLAPHLDGARALGAKALSQAAVVARWRLGNGATLTVHVNLGAPPLRCPRRTRGALLFESRAGAASALEKGRLLGFCTVARLEKT